MGTEPTLFTGMETFRLGLKRASRMMCDISSGIAVCGPSTMILGISVPIYERYHCAANPIIGMGRVAVSGKIVVPVARLSPLRPSSMKPNPR